MNYFDEALASLETLGQSAIAYAPRLLLAVIVLIVGWVVAKLLRKVAVKILRRLRVDEAAEKAGIENFLLKGGVRFTTVTLLAALLYWSLFFVSVFFALGILGLEFAQERLGQIIFYLPKIFIAVIILIFGSLVSKVAKILTDAFLNNLEIENAHAIGVLAQFTILVFVVFMALEQVSIGGEILVSAFQIAFGSAGLAFALAFGLGGKEVAKRAAEKFFNSFDSESR